MTASSTTKGRVKVTGNDDEAAASAQGIIGVGFALLKIEMSASGTGQVKVCDDTPFILCIDDPLLEKAQSWAKLPAYRQLFEFNSGAGMSFVLGDSTVSGDNTSYNSARRDTAAIAPGGLIQEDADGHLLVRAHAPTESATHHQSSISFLYSAPKVELEEVYRKLNAGTRVVIWGYEVISVKPAVPFDDSHFLPIHYTVKNSETTDDLHGALLRYEGNTMVLVPIDPLGNGGKNSKEAVTTKRDGVSKSPFFTSKTVTLPERWNWSKWDTIDWLTVKQIQKIRRF